jgi:group I intron endonuclease
MKTISVYKIVNLVNNKWYVGSTCDQQRRWKRHRKYLNNKGHDNAKLQSSWNIHGESNFKFETIRVCETIEEALLLEQSIIDEHFGKQYFYNLSHYAVLPSNEVKSKLREIANRQPKFSTESLAKCKQDGLRGAKKRWDTMTDEARQLFKLKMVDAAKRGYENSKKRKLLIYDRDCLGRYSSVTAI